MRRSFALLLVVAGQVGVSFRLVLAAHPRHAWLSDGAVLELGTRADILLQLASAAAAEIRRVVQILDQFAVVRLARRLGPAIVHVDLL